MPWLGDDMCMKDPQGLPGLSLVQWMNMQQNSALSSSLQQNYVPSLSGSVLQNLPGADISRQLGFSSPQISQPHNATFNAQRLLQTAQQLDHLQKLPSSSSTMATVLQPQQQSSDITQHRQNMLNQTLSQNQVQAQFLHSQNLVQTNNILQQQQQVQPSNQSHQLHRSLSQNPQQQQQQQQQPQQQTIMCQNQQQSFNQTAMSDHHQQLQMSDNQIQFQLLQKLQQQKQMLLAQQSSLQHQHPSQLAQIQDQQRQILDKAQNLSRALAPSQALEVLPANQNSLPEANSMTHQMINANSRNNIQFSHLPQQPKLQQQQSNLLSEMSSHISNNMLNGAAIAGQSVVTDDVPSCSTSPSTNNCANVLPPLMNSQIHRSTILGDDVAQSAARILNSNALETVSSNANLLKELQPKSEVKPSLNIPKNQNQGNFGPQTYLNGGVAYTDYLDTSSSTTSVCLSQNDAHMHQNSNNNPLSYNPQSMLFRDNSQDGEAHADVRSNIPYGSNIDSQMGIPLNPDSLLTKGGALGMVKDLSNNFSGSMLGNFENNRDAQQELSSSIVSQTFEVPDMTFNSIDSTIDDSSFLNRDPWAAPPPPALPPAQFQRMRTYTKVC